MRTLVFVLAVSFAALGGYILGRRTTIGQTNAEPLSVERVSQQPIAVERPNKASDAVASVTRPLVGGEQPELSEPGSESLTALTALAALRDQFPDAVKIPVLTNRDKIHNSFGALLGLSAVEINALNGHVEKARAQLNEYSTAHATVAFADDGTINVKVSPFNAGPAVYDQLMQAFGETLGDQRMDRFKRLFGDEFVEAFHQFGAQQRSLTIAETLPGYVDWKDGQYYIKDDRRTAAGQLESMSYRIPPDKMEYLFPHLKWLEPIIASRPPPVKSRPNDRPMPSVYEVTER